MAALTRLAQACCPSSPACRHPPPFFLQHRDRHRARAFAIMLTKASPRPAAATASSVGPAALPSGNVGGGDAHRRRDVSAAAAAREPGGGGVPQDGGGPLQAASAAATVPKVPKGPGGGPPGAGGGASAGWGRGLYTPPQLLLVCGLVSAYACSFNMQQPVLPYLVKAFGGDSVSYGGLITLFAVVQFFGGLIAGPLMDHYGPKWLMAISMAASVACYGLVGAAGALPMVMASRLPTLAQHAVLAARALATAASGEADRARALGAVGVAYGIGFAVGPALGGLLSGTSPDAAALQRVAWVATVASLACTAACALLRDAPAPASVPGAGAGAASPGKSHDGVGPVGLRSRLSLREYARVLRLPGVAHLLRHGRVSLCPGPVSHSLAGLRLRV